MVNSTLNVCVSPPPPPTHIGDPARSTKAWPLDDKRVVKETGRLVLNVGFRGGTERQHQAVKNVLKPSISSETKFTWADFANVEFSFDRPSDSKDILVSFARTNSSWSCIGTDSLAEIAEGKVSMNLGSLPDAIYTNQSDRATILHEFGHALGLMHEHQSPARESLIHLRDETVYRHFSPLFEHQRERVKSQVIDMYKPEEVAAFSELDRYSIMMYPMEGALNEEGIDIDMNLELSELDKAFVTLMYPPNLHQDGKLADMMHWMEVAGIPDRRKGVIIHAFNEKANENPADIRPAVQASRDAFITQNRQAMKLYRANVNILSRVKKIEPWKQYGIASFLDNLTNESIMRSVVTNVAKEVFQQHCIPMYQPQLSESDMIQVVERLITRPEVEDAVADSYHLLSGEELEKGEQKWYDRIQKATKETERRQISLKSDYGYNPSLYR